MTAAARRAFGLTRLRSRAGALCRAPVLGGRPVMGPAIARTDPSVVQQDLASLCDLTRRTVPELALWATAWVGWLEVANLTLALRALVHQVPRSTWVQHWRSWQAVSGLRVDLVAECATPSELAALLDRSACPWLAPPVRAVAGPGALSTSLAALARAAAVAVLDGSRGWPRAERDARALVDAWLVERDLEWLRRAPAHTGASPAAAARLTVVLGERLGGPATERLAADGPPVASRRLALEGRDWDTLLTALRRRRRRLAVRALQGPPFALALGVAIVLLKYEELRAAAALAETGGVPTPAALRAGAGSLMGG